MKPLFTLEDIQQHKVRSTHRCKNCQHCERHACGGSYFFYCGTRKSKLTCNGKLKIKANQDACPIFIKAANI